ncbi:MAG: hypothetical protein H6606_10195 [Flavobacteriales bacterium]|nr:hypothetical protein [Flavobacteriales bacterium]
MSYLVKFLFGCSLKIDPNNKGNRELIEQSLKGSSTSRSAGMGMVRS